MPVRVSARDDLARLLEDAEPDEIFELEAGTYVLDRTIRIRVPLVIKGEGGGAVLKNAEPEPVLRLATNGVVEVADVAFVHEGGIRDGWDAGWPVVALDRGEAAFTGCRFAGGRRGRDDEGGAGLAVEGDAVATLRACVAEDNEGAGVWVVDDARVNLDGCVLRRNDVGATYGGHASGLVRACMAESNARFGFLVLDEAKPTLAENTIRYNGAPGVSVGDQARPLVVDNKLDPADMAEPPSGVEPVPDDMRAPELVMETIQLASVALELGRGLVRYVDPDMGGDMMDRLVMMRMTIGLETGFIAPGIQVHQNDPDMPATHYRIYVRGQTVAEGELHPDCVLALRAPDCAATELLPGVPMADPVNGWPGVWIGLEHVDAATASGHVIVEPANVLIGHLDDVVRQCAWEILSRQEVKIMLDHAALQHPVAAKELVERLELGTLHGVLVQLLRDRVSIRDLPAILEAVSDASLLTRDPVALAEACRKRLARQVCQGLADGQNVVPVLTFDVETERRLGEALEPASDLPAQEALRRRNEVQERVATLLMGLDAMPRHVLLVSPVLRPRLAACLRAPMPRVAVLATDELHPAFRFVDPRDRGF